MVESDENRFSIAVRGGDGELLFSSDYITSFKFDLSENSLSATVDTDETDGLVFVTDGDTDER